MYLIGYQTDANGLTKLITLFDKVNNIVSPFDISCMPKDMQWHFEEVKVRRAFHFFSALLLLAYCVFVDVVCHVVFVTVGDW